MDFSKWIHLGFAVLYFIMMFIFVRPEKLKRIWLCGLIGVIMESGIQTTFIILHLLKYHKALFLIAGFPLSKLLDIFPLTILLINYLEQAWIKKIPLILFFTFINEIEVYLKLKPHALTFSQGFSMLTHFLFVFISFSLTVWAAEGLFKKKIHME